MRVLIVDDDIDFRRMLEIGLGAAGFECVVTANAEEGRAALEQAPGGSFDLIVLDVEMPGPSGWDVLYELRQAGHETPVIFVTGKVELEDKLKGLDLGADDYVCKPFEIDELVARIKAVLRRRDNLAPIVYGELALDLALRRVVRGEHAVDLTPREFDLLLMLVRARGEVISRADLLRGVWNMDADTDSNVLDVHMGRLRKKVDRHGRPLIHNERGKGYRIVALGGQEA